MFSGASIWKVAIKKLGKIKDKEFESSPKKGFEEIKKNELDISLHTISHDERSDISDLSENDDRIISTFSQSSESVKKKSCKFSVAVNIHTIPCRSDVSGYFPELYWSREDYAEFRSDAVSELKIFMTNTGISGKMALKLMYQPDNVIESDKIYLALKIMP